MRQALIAAANVCHALTAATDIVMLPRTKIVIIVLGIVIAVIAKVIPLTRSAAESKFLERKLVRGPMLIAKMYMKDVLA